MICGLQSCHLTDTEELGRDLGTGELVRNLCFLSILKEICEYIEKLCPFDLDLTVFQDLAVYTYEIRGALWTLGPFFLRAPDLVTHL